MLKDTDYSSFIQKNFRLLSFGIIMAFASSFGQTYFIGVFGPAICSEFELSFTSWSSIYMIGTLLSALLLPWTGALIDRVTLPRYVACVLLSLILATFFMAAIPSVFFLLVGIFLLRQTGQGLMSHVSSTTMARNCFENRGKALAIASLGMAMGEATLPLLAHISINQVGWRLSYGIAGFFTLICILPIAYSLIHGTLNKTNNRINGLAFNTHHKAREGDWSRKAVLRDIKFYLLLPATTAPALIGTGLFFHHSFLAELKNWDVSWFTGSYWIYALGSMIAMIGVGPIIDRISATKVLPLHLLPMALSLLLISIFDNAWWAWPYFLFLGITTGISHAGVTALWAELYGLKNLGSIKSLSTSIAVFASSLGPISLGIMMDSDVRIEHIFFTLIAYCFLTSWLFIVTIKKYK